MLLVSIFMHYLCRDHSPADVVMTQHFQRVDATIRSANQRQFPKPRKGADDMAAL